VREFRHLKTKKGRDDSGLFIIEGEKFVSEIPEDWEIIRYIFSQHYASTSGMTPYHNKAPVEVVRDSLFCGMSDTKSPQGIMAVVKQKHYAMHDITSKCGFILYGESLNDPGNIGTLIRTATAAGATGMILGKNSGDMYNPKVLRASAGAVLRLPVVTNADLEKTIDCLRQLDYSIYATVVDGDILPYNLDLRNNFCYLVGNESHGLTSQAIALSDAKVCLPMARDMESLNASVAGGILLYEALRQRL